MAMPSAAGRESYCAGFFLTSYLIISVRSILYLDSTLEYVLFPVFGLTFNMFIDMINNIIIKAKLVRRLGSGGTNENTVSTEPV